MSETEYNYLGWIEPRWNQLFNLLPKSFDGQTILDVGMGWGFLGWMIRNNYPDDDIYLVGVDGYKPFVENQRKMKIYDAVFHKRIDEMKIMGECNYVFCLETLEHNSKEYSLKVIDSLKWITENTLYISVPYKEPVKNMDRQYTSFKLKMKSNNPYSPHVSSWSEQDFRDHRFEHHIIDNRKNMSRSVRLFDALRRRLFNIWYEKILLCIWS